MSAAGRLVVIFEDDFVYKWFAILSEDGAGEFLRVFKPYVGVLLAECVYAFLCFVLDTFVNVHVSD